MDISEDMKLQNGLVIYRDWDCEGAIYMRNAKTVERYKELRGKQFDTEANGVFFAFSDEQYDRNYKSLIRKGSITKEDIIYRLPVSGCYGTVKGWMEMQLFYRDIDLNIRETCDPQEVYFYEYNNHECMISWDGDEDAIRHIIRIYGQETAKAITRYNAYSSIEDIVKKYEA